MPHQCTTCGHTFEDGSKEMLSGCPSCGGSTFQFRPSGASATSSGASSDDAPPNDSPPETPPKRDSGGVAERMGRTATAMRDWMHDDSAESADPRGRTGADTEPTDSGRTTSGPNATADAGTGADAADSSNADDTSDGDAPSTAWPDPPDVSHVREGRDGRPTGPPSDERSRDEHSRDEGPRNERPPADRSPANPGHDLPTDEDGLIVADDHDPSNEAAEDTAQASARSEMARPDELPPREDRSTDAPSSGRVVSEPTGESPDVAELREELNEQFESIKIVEPGQYELNLMELYDRPEYIISLRENGRYVIQMPDDWLGDPED